MKRTILHVVTAIAGFAASAGLALAETDIPCPLDQARRIITDDIPAGWWTTPIVNRLTETRVDEIGGKPTLVCVYGSSGSVQRNAPEGESCTAIPGGFICAAASPPPAQTYTTGPMDIAQDQRFDLDRGLVGPSSADFWLQAESDSLLYLVPQGGALIDIGDRSNRGQAGCEDARLNDSRVSLLDIPAGSYVCFMTNERRIGQFRVNGLSGISSKTLSLGYTTWQ